MIETLLLNNKKLCIQIIRNFKYTSSLICKSLKFLQLKLYLQFLIKKSPNVKRL